MLEVEAVGWGAEGGFAVGEAGGLVEEGGEVVEAEAALGCVDGGTGEEADHFVEEAIAFPGDAVAIGEGFEIGAVDGAEPIHVRQLVAAVGGEGVEVVSAEI